MLTLRLPHHALLALGLGLIAAPALAQDAREAAPVASFLFTVNSPAEPESEDDELHGLLEDLERAAHALEVLGDREALHHVLGAAASLRERIEGERHSDDINELSTRLDILREARHAWAEIERKEQVNYLNRVLHVGELQMEGASAEALAEAMQGVSLETLIELLEQASNIWAEFGDEHRSKRCAHLAEYYANRGEGDDEDHDHEHEVHEHDDDGEHGFPEWLEKRGARVEILALSAKALAEAGDEEAADHMQRFAHLGHLQVQEVSDERIAEASVGLNMEAAIHQLRDAAEHLEHKGKHEAAHACALLSEWYVRRDFGEEVEEEEEPVEWDARELDLEQRPVRLEILEVAMHAHAEAGHEQSARYLRRFLHFGHLQEEGANPEQLAEAAQGLSMEAAIHELLGASELYAKWGHPERAHLCEALAQRYAGQFAEAEQAAEQSDAEREQGMRSSRSRRWPTTSVPCRSPT